MDSTSNKSPGLQIIGAGLHRTGTLSLKLALERLGYGPCYHMYEMMRLPESVWWWRRAASGERIDWQVIYGDYCSAVDWPTCYFWRQLVEVYPKAKVILTVRDPEQWYESHARLHRGVLQMAKSDAMRLPEGHTPLMRQIMVRDTFGGRLFGREHCLGIYNGHVDRVRSVVPRSRLLVFDVRDGWGPLCEFLGVDVPHDENFPHANEATDVFSNMRQAGDGGRGSRAE